MKWGKYKNNLESINNEYKYKYKKNKIKNNNQEFYPVHPNVLNMLKSSLTKQG